MDEGLKKEIQFDKERRLSSYCRYPVRFIFMDINSKVQEDIASLLEDYELNILDLSSKMLHSDAWITKKDLLDLIMQCPKDKDTVVIGFSEMARFYSNEDFEAVLLSLVQFENDTSVEIQAERRIYFICFGMRDMIQNVLLHKHHRIEIYNPFLNVDYKFEEPIKDIYFASDQLKSLQTNNVIKTSSEWIGLWKNATFYDFSKPFISYSKTLYEWYCKASPDNVFQIGKLDNYKEFIEKLAFIEVPIDYKAKDEDNWFNLYKIFSSSALPSLRMVVMKYANVSDISLKSLLESWLASSDEFVRWLLKGYIIAGYGASYVSYILTKMEGNSNSEFYERYWLDCLPGSGYSAERKEYFSTINKYSEFIIPEEKLNKRYITDFNNWITANYPVPCSVEGDISKIDYCALAERLSTNLDDFFGRIKDYYKRFIREDITTISVVDRKYALHLFSNNIISAEELYKEFPEIECYFQSKLEKNSKNEWLIEYFNEYRSCKVHNEASEQFNALCKKYNNSNESFYEWYYAVNSRNEIISGLDEKIDVFVIDGVGGEWIDAICCMIEKQGYTVCSASYSRANLPTITDINKNKIKNYKNWFYDFDRNCLHGEIYSAPQNIIKGYDILLDIVKKIITEQNGEPFIITSDHGATACHRFKSANKKYNFEKADHGGRCCRTEKKISDEKDYFCYQDEGGNYYILSLNENSLYKQDIYEGHGGATIEEVIVPVIYANSEKNEAASKSSIKYIVTPQKLMVDGINRSVEFTIVPHPNKVTLKEETGSQCELYEIGGIWTCDLSVGKKQRIIIIIENQMFEFETVSTTANMMGDDGFD